MTSISYALFSTNKAFSLLYLSAPFLLTITVWECGIEYCAILDGPMGHNFWGARVFGNGWPPHGSNGKCWRRLGQSTCWFETNYFAWLACRWILTAGITRALRAFSREAGLVMASILLMAKALNIGREVRKFWTSTWRPRSRSIMPSAGYLQASSLQVSILQGSVCIRAWLWS